MLQSLLTARSSVMMSLKHRALFPQISSEANPDTKTELSTLAVRPVGGSKQAKVKAGFCLFSENLGNKILKTVC